MSGKRGTGKESVVGKKDDRLTVRPGKVGARLIALRHLEDADTGRDKLREGSGPEALHDFRVAIRRLRSTLRAYADSLDDSVRARDRKRLKSLARATGESRDREVQLERLAQIEAADADEADAIAWLVARLEASKQESDARVTRVIDRIFPRERARLMRQLRQYREELDPEHPESHGLSMGEVAAGLVTVLAATVEARLAAVRNVEDQAGAHGARISGKRLRYTLEPFRKEVPLAANVVERLRKLQDDLGAMHDAHVLGAEVGAVLDRPSSDAVPENGLRALAARFREERDRRYEGIREDWMGREAARFFEDARAVARQLRTRGRGAEARRTFLLHGMPSLLRWRSRSLRVDEGWLPGDAVVERIRRERAKDWMRFTRTVEVEKGGARVSIEEDLSKEAHLPFWRLTRGRRLRKRRYLMEHEGLTWEIDRFLDRELVLAHVEPPGEDAPVSIPPWLEPFIDREITGDADYYDIALAL